MFIKRLGYYILGFSLGLVLLVFFFNKKNTSCNYFPQKRVKNDLLKKKILINDTLLIKDTIFIRKLIRQSKVNFRKSKLRRDSCKMYVVEGNKKNNTYSITLNNCKKSVVIQSIIIN